MGGKLAASLFALVFAIPFGGGGLFAGWVIADMVSENQKSAEWVVVKATVQSAELRASRGRKSTTYEAAGTYRYRFGGKEYTGAQLGLSSVGGADNIGDWQEDMAGYLKEAMEKRQPISVYVNPDDPAQAVVDRELRWGFIAFLGVFAVIFGGVGIGALLAFFGIWSGALGTGAAKKGGRRANRPAAAPRAGKAIAAKGTGLGFLWLFAILWNAISMPAAFIAVPGLWNDGEWAGLLILIFPLIGALLLWGVIAQSVQLLRRGKPTLSLQPESPATGEPFEGAAVFARGVGPGSEWVVRLVRHKKVTSGNRSENSEEWSRELKVKASAHPQGARVAFRFTAPDVARPGPEDDEEEGEHSWTIQVKPVQGGLHYDFPIPIRSPAPGMRDARFANAPAIPATRIDPELERLFGAQAPLEQKQRRAIAQLTPEQQQLVAKAVKAGPILKKVAIAIFFVFLAVQVVLFVKDIAR
jgi:hypothetical protein